LVIDMIVTNEADGFNAEVPSLKGCESWAHSEDDAIKNVIELTRYYISLNEKTEIKVDLARRSGRKKIYKLVFDKE